MSTDRISLDDPDDLELFQSDTIIQVFDPDGAATIGGEKLKIHVFAYETANYSIHAKAQFRIQARSVDRLGMALMPLLLKPTIMFCSIPAGLETLSSVKRLRSIMRLSR